MDISQMIDAWGKIGTGVIAICGAITALCALIKPLRKPFVKIFSHADEQKKQLEDIKNELKNDFKDVKDDVKNTHEEISEVCKELNNKIDAVREANDENERDRLKGEILKYESFAKNRRPITEREFENIRDSYHKYHETLHGNGKVTEAYNFIVNYYNETAGGWM